EDPRTLPTDRLPDREEFDRYSAPLLARRSAQPARPPGPDGNADAGEPDATTGAIPTLDEHGEVPEAADPGTAAAAGEPVHPPAASYARSGTTPNAADDEVQLRGIVLPDRFRALGVFDALRDVLALICLVSALTTTFTLGADPWIDGYGKAAIGTGLVALIAVHLLRWIPTSAPLSLVRLVRMIGLLPALITGISVVAADLVLSLPVLMASLPEGPPVGIGVG